MSFEATVLEDETSELNTKVRAKLAGINISGNFHELSAREIDQPDVLILRGVWIKPTLEESQENLPFLVI